MFLGAAQVQPLAVYQFAKFPSLFEPIKQV
jgi:hypothetical protein